MVGVIGMRNREDFLARGEGRFAGVAIGSSLGFSVIVW